MMSNSSRLFVKRNKGFVKISKELDKIKAKNNRLLLIK